MAKLMYNIDPAYQKSGRDYSKQKRSQLPEVRLPSQSLIRDSDRDYRTQHKHDPTFQLPTRY